MIDDARCSSQAAYSSVSQLTDDDKETLESLAKARGVTLTFSEKNIVMEKGGERTTTPISMYLELKNAIQAIPV